MDKKLVIIIPNELEINIKPFLFHCQKFHIEGIKKFIYQYDLSVSSINIENSDKVSKELVDQGFCIIHTDEYKNGKNLLVYLPINISPNQLQYFDSQKEQLKNYDLMILSKESNEKFKIIDQTITDKPILDILMEKLNSRLIKNNKRKVLSPKI